MRAVLLIGLNTCKHSGEAGAILKSEINLSKATYAGRRPKTRRPCVAKLWPRTVKALQAYQAEATHASPHMFVSGHGNQLSSETIRQSIVRLRERIGLPETVTFEGLRDAAFTVAQEVDKHHADFIAGHSTGMSDRYVLRQAANKKVIACCQAIERHFFG